uniref:Uncharacterized protein n=1 Tax=Denticeps clupeoides TaxID=299321 RepID=A0AAY4BS33_9TELE
MQMTQNMFQEGLYHVFFKERPQPRPTPTSSGEAEMRELRLVRWVMTVVNTRLLVTGVVQLVGSLACILSTVSFACVSSACSVSMTTPVWSSLFFLAAGGLAVVLQKNPDKVKVLTLTGLNIFSFLLGMCALFTFTLMKPSDTKTLTIKQRVGVSVMKGTSVVFLLQCVLASLYTLLLVWRGLRRYRDPQRTDYSRVFQVTTHTHTHTHTHITFHL